MNVEEQLRDYQATLDAASDDAADARLPHAVVPIRIPPARTLILAAVAVAATIAVAFAAVGVVHRNSKTPAAINTTTTPTSASSPITAATTVAVPDVAGLETADAAVNLTKLGFVVVTKTATPCSAAPGIVISQQPSPGARAARGSSVIVTECTGPSVGAPITLPVVACNTVYGNTKSPSDHAPTSVTVGSPSFTSPTVSGYSDSSGFLPTTAPVGWGCRALVTADGNTEVDVTPPGVPVGTTCCTDGRLTRTPSDGVFAYSVSSCFGCVFLEACAIVPGVATDADFAGQGPCPAAPAGQTVTAVGDNTYRIDDPPGALGPDAAHSVLKYQPHTPSISAWVERDTCVLPSSQQGECDALLDQFLALNPNAGS